MHRSLISQTWPKQIGRTYCWCKSLRQVELPNITDRKILRTLQMMFWPNFLKLFGMFLSWEHKVKKWDQLGLFSSKNCKDSTCLLKEWKKLLSIWREPCEVRSVWALNWTTSPLHCKAEICHQDGLNWHLKLRRNLVVGWCISQTELNNITTGPKYRSLPWCGFLASTSLNLIWLPWCRPLAE